MVVLEVVVATTRDVIRMTSSLQIFTIVKLNGDSARKKDLLQLHFRSTPTIRSARERRKIAHHCAYDTDTGYCTLAAPKMWVLYWKLESLFFTLSRY